MVFDSLNELFHLLFMESSIHLSSSAAIFLAHSVHAVHVESDRSTGLLVRASGTSLRICWANAGRSPSRYGVAPPWKNLGYSVFFSNFTTVTHSYIVSHL